jgi:hypothetical protein
MANPGPYPPMGHMQQMGGPQMPPMGMRPPMRQGTSHIVPVVVSAGLAVGVFCGLLFGLGTKHESEPIKASNGAKQSEESQIQTAAVSTGSAKAPVTSPTPAAGSAAAVAGGVAPNVGGAAGSAAAAVPARPGKLTIEIKPDGAAASAKIFIDGRQLTTGTTADILFDPGTKQRTVKVVVQAAGYQEEQRDETVKSEEATSLSIPLKAVKAAASTATGDDAKPGSGSKADGGQGGQGGQGGKSDGAKGTGNKGNGKGSGKSNTKGNGLIDI